MKIKLWISLVLAFFVFIFITQNTEMANVKFLVWSIEISLVLIVFITFFTGIIIGWLLNSYLRFSAKRNVPVADDADESDQPAQAESETLSQLQDEEVKEDQ